MKKRNKKNKNLSGSKNNRKEDFWLMASHTNFRIKNIIVNTIVILIFVIPLTIFGVVSVMDKDKTLSELENRALKQAPEFTVNALFNGEFTKDFDEYYADTFPLRDFFLSINKKITVFLTQNAGSDDIVLVPKGDAGEDFAGEGIIEEK